MTVGITFTNGLEAIVITDKRVSGSGRQSDSVDKMGEFNGAGYQGVIFGSGSGSLVESVIQRLDKLKGETPPEFVINIYNHLQDKLTGLITFTTKEEQNKIKRKAKFIADEEAQKQFVQGELARLIEGIDKRIGEHPDFRTEFIVTLYDTATERVANFYINRSYHGEAFAPHHEIGSGADAANLYLSAALQGVDNKKLTAGELLFYVITAYAHANLNEGVGGTPKIAHISERGCKILPVEQSKALTNLSGAYVSRYEPSLTPDIMKKYCRELLAGKKNYFNRIARMLKMTPDSLTTMAVPYSSWQERANSR